MEKSGKMEKLKLKKENPLEKAEREVEIHPPFTPSAIHEIPFFEDQKIQTGNQIAPPSSDVLGTSINTPIIVADDTTDESEDDEDDDRKPLQSCSSSEEDEEEEEEGGEEVDEQKESDSGKSDISLISKEMYVTKKEVEKGGEQKESDERSDSGKIDISVETYVMKRELAKIDNVTQEILSCTNNNRKTTENILNDLESMDDILTEFTGGENVDKLNYIIKQYLQVLRSMVSISRLDKETCNDEGQGLVVDEKGRACLMSKLKEKMMQERMKKEWGLLKDIINLNNKRTREDEMIAEKRKKITQEFDRDLEKMESLTYADLKELKFKWR